MGGAGKNRRRAAPERRVGARASRPGAWMSISIRIWGEKYATCGPITAIGWPPAAYFEVTASQLLMAPVKFSMLTGGEVYLMAFRVAGPKPAPDQIKPCGA